MLFRTESKIEPVMRELTEEELLHVVGGRRTRYDDDNRYRRDDDDRRRDRRDHDRDRDYHRCQ
jgi:hypothetical protein